MDIVLYALLVFGGVFLLKVILEWLAGHFIAGMREATMRQCPECLAEIPRAARRCQHCGVAVEPLSIARRSST